MGAFFPVILLTPTPISSAHNLYLFQMLELQENITDSQPMDPPSLEIMMLHHLMIILVTLFGNTLLIYVIYKNNAVLRRKRVTPVQMLMLHMCAADILFALISVGPTMAITATVPFFYGPNLLCKLTKFLQVIPMYASSFLLVAISADRYQAICRPLASMKSSIYNRPALYSGIAWTAAILFSTPQLYLFEKRNGDCSENYTTALQYQLYVCLFNSVVWLLPSAIAGWLYLCVCKAVWKSTSFSSSLRNNMKKMEHMKLTEKNGGMQAHHKGATMQCVELDRRRVQTVKLTLTIVAANFVLWAPFCITSVIDAVWPTAINSTFATYIMFFGNLNSCMNPWLWFHFNRKQLKRACPCRKSSEPLIQSLVYVHVMTSEQSDF
ncbi:Nematocin receptor 1 [Caenorhabditis elegans]|uniref:Nematocin receptor 1 n=1 Tax=Caenorhabditis elegans TaxID=6239 RepID=NTR1_CAEEL|nr:Nematocin receptor 1 [Caenorhabditis elegans]O02300.1 RecName: Full=Nematocin receptor 1 [Caenorhabditis elegans]AFJ42569.1 NTR-1 [Caenorhabditis elegans]CAB04712.1 Nematocin receptor 1 [Caenorhabditis elegans]|eukprot:NP_493193.1 Nematocin receptor 1 [Caenorhabditis elegans]